MTQSNHTPATHTNGAWIQKGSLSAVRASKPDVGDFMLIAYQAMGKRGEGTQDVYVKLREKSTMPGDVRFSSPITGFVGVSSMSIGVAPSRSSTSKNDRAFHSCDG